MGPSSLIRVLRRGVTDLALPTLKLYTEWVILTPVPGPRAIARLILAHWLRPIQPLIDRDFYLSQISDASARRRAARDPVLHYFLIGRFLDFAPNPDFPTVAFPNPEEPGAMDLALEEGLESDADIVIANDPDADRCAAAVPTRDRGASGGPTIRMLRGDEVGALLGWWLQERQAPTRIRSCRLHSCRKWLPLMGFRTMRP